MVNKSKNYRANVKLLAIRNFGKEGQNLKRKQERIFKRKQRVIHKRRLGGTSK